MNYIIAALLTYIAFIQTIAVTQSDKHLKNISNGVQFISGEVELIRIELKR